MKEGKFLDEDRFWQTFNNGFSVEVENNMATIAQKMEQRGIERGIETVARKLLSEKNGLSNKD